MSVWKLGRAAVNQDHMKNKQLHACSVCLGQLEFSKLYEYIYFYYIAKNGAKLAGFITR